MLALSVTFTRSVLDFSTSCIPVNSCGRSLNSNCLVKRQPRKQLIVAVGSLVSGFSRGGDGQRFSYLVWRKNCHLGRRLSSSRRHDPYGVFLVFNRAVAILAHEDRPVLKVSGDTSTRPLNSSVVNSGKDFSEAVEPTVDAGVQIPERQEDEDVDERERLRRQRIGLANKGKVPWNKGRNHSPETIERIRERTYQAMHSPKVMAKLKLNPRHPQSDETRIKIRNKLREKWDLKKKIRGYQDYVHKEWKELVAEAARLGGLGEEEHEWNSHSIIKKRLREQQRQEQLRKSPKKDPKPRPVKTAAHRQRISAAIRAKWEDPEYQQKVRDGMTKTSKVSLTSRRMKSPESGTGVFEKKTRSEKAMDQSFIDAVMSAEKPRRVQKSDYENLDDQKVSMLAPVQWVKIPAQPIRKVNLLEKGILHPEPEEKSPGEPLMPVDEPTASKLHLYMDPNAQEKLKKLRLLQANRAVMEQRRKQSAYHARVLMAEAEKAANALEAAASKDEFAMASLTETRRLMAEAARLIQTAESGKIRLTGSNQPL